MELDAMVEAKEPEDLDIHGAKKIRRRMSFPEVIWREMGDCADKYGLTREEYLERLHNNSAAAESDVAEYKKMLAASAATLELYRERLETAGVDIKKFDQD